MGTPRAGEVPDRTVTRRVCGVRLTFRYYHRAADVTLEPDADDLGAAPGSDLVRCWQAVGDWAARFKAANPGWTVGGDGDEDAVLLE